MILKIRTFLLCSPFFFSCESSCKTDDSHGMSPLIFSKQIPENNKFKISSVAVVFSA